MIAHNRHGSSDPSTLLTVTTDTDVPDAPTGVATALSTDELSVETTWTEPNDNGDAITSYTVYIQKKDTTY